jgi:menaquinone-dependent protoporphyrinogen oxidase
LYAQEIAMTFLIVYGTTEGQTRKIAERIAARVRELGREAELHDSSALLENLQVGMFDAIIVAASVHQQQHQDSVTEFAFAYRDQLQTKPAAFLSVSLSAALEDDKREAQKYVDQFVAETGWRPAEILLVAGALRYAEYDFFREQIVKHIVLKGRGAAVAKCDCEFTDWETLFKFVDSFVTRASG